MTIRPLEEDALDKLTEMICALWPECDAAEERLNYTRILKSTREGCLVARVGETIAGFIHLSVRHEHVEGATGSPVAYIEGVYVEPQYRRTGVGRALVNAGRQWGAQMGCRHYASDAELHNTASHHFHLANGFREVNRVVCYVQELPDTYPGNIDR
ncbi:MAG: aminoglycoside 6'-N-acetyltransferase [Saprospiraceae bacterium]|nr:aminoglycoside 6'-N-acetyltransferase [Saprospiraceae bacterium]